MYTITLNDGTKIDGLRLERNILWRKQEMTAAMFRGKLAPVTITAGKDDKPEEEDFFGLVGTHDCMTVAYIRQENGEYGLALGTVDPETLADERRDANIAYIAMMTGVEL